MNQTVLPQLQTIEAELVAKESQLAAQLASVREKLTGIQTVMPMFLESADSATQKDSVKESAVAAPEAAEAEATEATDTETTETESTELEVTAPKEKKSKKVAAEKKETEKKTVAKKVASKKKDGRAASWQKYTRPGVKNESIPDAVRLILETQPQKDFKIAEVMDALFKEDMPKTQYLKARNRISNVLSGGVRAGDWYKGERGTYRMATA